MKTKLYAILIPFALFGCQQKDDSKTYVPKELTTTENLNQYAKTPGDSLSVTQLVSDKSDKKDTVVKYAVKFKGAGVKIQTNKSTVTDRFVFAEFVNTQKTTLLAQVADSSGLAAPFYLISLQGDSVAVISLYRASNGKEDSKFTKGLSKIGLTGYLINNDYFVTTVLTKVYPIKRQNPEERIQGIPFINSSDRQTLGFLTGNSIYQVHYRSSTVFTQPLPTPLPENNAALYAYVQSNYTWVKNKEGIYFLKSSGNSDKIVDMTRKL